MRTIDAARACGPALASEENTKTMQKGTSKLECTVSMHTFYIMGNVCEDGVVGSGTTTTSSSFAIIHDYNNLP